MIGFESDHDPELSAVISLGGRISANRDVTNVNKNKFRYYPSLEKSKEGI